MVQASATKHLCKQAVVLTLIETNRCWRNDTCTPLNQTVVWTKTVDISYIVLLEENID